MRTTACRSIAALALLVVPAVAGGEPPARRARTRTVVHGVIPVHGELQQPQAFDLTSRSRGDYSAADRPQDFRNHVVTATRRSPF